MYSSFSEISNLFKEANLVVNQRARTTKATEPTGEGETLAGIINPKEMGSLAQKEKLSNLMQKAKEKSLLEKRKAQSKVLNPKKKVKMVNLFLQSIYGLKFKKGDDYRREARKCGNF